MPHEVSHHLVSDDLVHLQSSHISRVIAGNHLLLIQSRKGNYIVAATKDSGTLQAFTFLSQAKRVDFGRVLVLRTVSNYDRDAPGVTAAESLRVQALAHSSIFEPCQNVFADKTSPLATNGGFSAFGKPAHRARDLRKASESVSDKSCVR